MQRKIKSIFRSRKKHTPDSAAAASNPAPTPTVRDVERPRPTNPPLNRDGHKAPVPQRGRAMSVAVHSGNSALDNAPGVIEPNAGPKTDSPGLNRNRSTKDSHQSGPYGQVQRTNSTKAASIPSLTSLGGDPTLMREASVKKYSEDVADRNLERSGSTYSSRRNSTEGEHFSLRSPNSMRSVKQTSLSRRNRSEERRVGKECPV